MRLPCLGDRKSRPYECRASRTKVRPVLWHGSTTTSQNDNCTKSARSLNGISKEITMGTDDDVSEEIRSFAMTLVWRCTGCGYQGETGCTETCMLPQECPGCGAPVEDLVVVTED